MSYLLGGFRDLGALEVLGGLGDLRHLGDLRDLLGGFNRPTRIRRLTTLGLTGLLRRQILTCVSYTAFASYQSIL